jgi:hypothetical protein
MTEDTPFLCLILFALLILVLRNRGRLGSEYGKVLFPMIGGQAAIYSVGDVIIRWMVAIVVAAFIFFIYTYDLRKTKDRRDLRRSYSKGL